MNDFYFYDCDNGLHIDSKKFSISLNKIDDLFHRIVDIEFDKKEEELIIYLDNGHLIEIYFHNNGILCIKSD